MARVRALEDRAIILHFDPPNTVLHRKVGEHPHRDESLRSEVFTLAIRQNAGGLAKGNNIDNILRSVIASLTLEANVDHVCAPCAGRLERGSAA
jgi:hypothetical protein